MLQIKRKFIGIRLLKGTEVVELSNDLTQKRMELLHKQFEGKYTYIKRIKVIKTIKKSKLNDDNDSKGND